MGKSLEEKYVIIENFHLDFNNRGNSALCYGAISFLEKNHKLQGHKLLNLRIYRNPLKKNAVKKLGEVIDIQGKKYTRDIIAVNVLEYKILLTFGILLPFTDFGKAMRKLDYLASDYGGDGFSDIYGEYIFRGRLKESLAVKAAKKPLIILPQTIGPFKNMHLKKLGTSLLKYATNIYARDNKCEEFMKELGLSYELTNDLSAFMEPEPWDIIINTHEAVGLNISGLAYSGGWRDLKGQFESYPLLIEAIIEHFQKLGKTVYLIPHSYNYQVPELDNDDMQASRECYENLRDKTNVVFVDKNLSAPQVKYVISKMSFFIGTRMHANYAAIFTKVPLFGLAYSYKFEGAFNNNGLYGQTAMINNLSQKEIPALVEKINAIYEKYLNDIL